ncbi:MAG: DMT family transporter [Sphingomonadales bacterium]|nr:DMT family transporter [Sphingomonadales bacterium]
MRRLHADLILVFAAVIWGVAFIFQKTAMDHVEPLTFIAARGAVAVLALAPLALYEQRRSATPAHPRVWRIALAGGAVFFAGAWLQQEGIKTASVTNTGFLTALYVVITPFVAWMAMGRVPSWLVWPAVVLSALGTWLLGGGSIGAFSRGDGLVALSAFFWAGHVVMTGTAARYGRPIGFTVVQFAVVGMLAAIGAVAWETVTLEGLRGAAWDIAFVGLLSSALTFTLLTVALQHTPPSEAAVIVSTETMFAALAAYLVLGERLPGIGWIGAGLILLATLLVQLGPSLIAARRSRGAPTV